MVERKQQFLRYMHASSKILLLIWKSLSHTHFVLFLNMAARPYLSIFMDPSGGSGFINQWCFSWPISLSQCPALLSPPCPSNTLWFLHRVYRHCYLQPHSWPCFSLGRHSGTYALGSLRPCLLLDDGKWHCFILVIDELAIGPQWHQLFLPAGNKAWAKGALKQESALLKKPLRDKAGLHNPGCHLRETKVLAIIARKSATALWLGLTLLQHRYRSVLHHRVLAAFQGGLTQHWALESSVTPLCAFTHSFL